MRRACAPPAGAARRVLREARRARERVGSALARRMLMHLFEHVAARWNDARRTTIAEVMTTSAHTIASDETLARAYQAMREHHLGHLPVLADGKLVGVLSQQDLHAGDAIDEGTALFDRLDGVEVLLREHAYELADVVCTMGAHHRCAVVVDLGRVIGIFIAADALALLARAVS